MKRLVVGAVALGLTVCLFVTCGALFVYGANAGYDYRSLPRWFASSMEFCFFSAIGLGMLSIFGLVIDRENKHFTMIALIVNFLTCMLVGFCTTPN